jgi:hypothetical protein
MEGSMSRGRSVVTVALVVLVLASVAVACGDDGGGKVSSGSEQSTTSNTSAQSYIGLTKREAILKAEATNTPWRITREDKETFMVTQDFVENRINFEIDDGEITNATYG